MTPEQYSAVIDAWVWTDQQIHTYGPGLALAGICIAITRTYSKIRNWRERRATREQRAALQQTAHQSNSTNHLPHIPTQPGHDDDLLTACWNAWKANPRTEDQP